MKFGNLNSYKNFEYPSIQRFLGQYVNRLEQPHLSLQWFKDTASRQFLHRKYIYFTPWLVPRRPLQGPLLTLELCKQGTMQWLFWFLCLEVM